MEIQSETFSLQQTGIPLGAPGCLVCVSGNSTGIEFPLPTRIRGECDVEEYLTTAEVAVRLKLNSKTVRNKIASGEFVQGIHFFKRKGMRARFKWSAVKRWLEEKEQNIEDQVQIPMKKGVVLRIPLTKKVTETIRTINGLSDNN